MASRTTDPLPPQVTAAIAALPTLTEKEANVLLAVAYTTLNENSPTGTTASTTAAAAPSTFKVGLIDMLTKAITAASTTNTTTNITNIDDEADIFDAIKPVFVPTVSNVTDIQGGINFISSFASSAQPPDILCGLAACWLDASNSRVAALDSHCTPNMISNYYQALSQKVAENILEKLQLQTTNGAGRKKTNSFKTRTASKKKRNKTRKR